MENLSPCQQKAKEAIIRLLVTNRKELIISGIGGAGKSWLIDNIHNIIDEASSAATLVGKDLTHLDFYTAKTATTAIAAVNLNQATTIHKFLGLMPINGELIRKNKFSLNLVKLLIIDECGRIDGQLDSYIQSYKDQSGCKIIYFGDKAQLTAVSNEPKTIFDVGIDTVDMVTPVRQKEGSDLFKLCTDLREAVIDDSFADIMQHINNEEIIHVDKDTFIDMAAEDFTNGVNAKILCFTNAKAIEYNEVIYNMLDTSTTADIAYSTGTVLESNSYQNYYAQDAGPVTLSNAEKVTVVGASKPHRNEAGFWHAYISFRKSDTFKVYRNVPVALTPMGDFSNEYTIKNKTFRHFLDMRLEYCCTAHKAQGSTYDNTYIDLSDLDKCRDDDMFRRLLYVAVSRSRGKVIFTGSIK